MNRQHRPAVRPTVRPTITTCARFVVGVALGGGLAAAITTPAAAAPTVRSAPAAASELAPTPPDDSEAPDDTLGEPCQEWDPDTAAVAQTVNGDGTVTVTIGYASAVQPCPLAIVVRSVSLDDDAVTIATLDEVTLDLVDIVAAPESTVEVTVPHDPCFGRVDTVAGGSYPLAEDYIGGPDLCSDDVDTTVPDEGPGTTDPAPQLPATGSSQVPMIALSSGLILLGLATAGATRIRQTR